MFGLAVMLYAERPIPTHLNLIGRPEYFGRFFWPSLGRLPRRFDHYTEISCGEKNGTKIIELRKDIPHRASFDKHETVFVRKLFCLFIGNLTSTFQIGLVTDKEYHSVGIGQITCVRQPTTQVVVC